MTLLLIYSTSSSGFPNTHEPIPCIIKTLINSVQIINERSQALVAEFQLEHVEVVDNSPSVVCLIISGSKAGVYYFDSPEVSYWCALLALR